MVYAIRNSATKRIFLCVSDVHTHLGSISCVHMGVELLGQRICVCSALLETPNLFFKVLVLVFAFTNSMHEFLFFHILAKLWFVMIFLILSICYGSNWSEMVSFGFNLQLSHNNKAVIYFWAICAFSPLKSSSLLPIFLYVCHFVFGELFKYSGYESFIGCVYIANIFSKVVAYL